MKKRLSILQKYADCNICAEDEKAPLDSAIDNEHCHFVEILSHKLLKRNDIYLQMHI